jgi:hypothetical protein
LPIESFLPAASLAPEGMRIQNPRLPSLFQQAPRQTLNDSLQTADHPPAISRGPWKQCDKPTYRYYSPGACVGSRLLILDSRSGT